ncbi:hypothetical protein IMAU20062_01932 [Lactobacillus helveticus]|uniref:hypothetical protein n=1 Tax=Lactobacillus helveticus TaxID=1587 RepID=UPI00156730D5|nr:hypothetical protein [Lactobacillus helveticus]NRO83420.1 hypothetical protein [Lactobacillus helveticus]
MKDGTEGVIVVNLSLEKLNPNTTYSYLTNTDNGDLVKIEHVTTSNGFTDLDYNPAIKIPFVIGSKRVKIFSKKNYHKGKIAGRYNRHVKIYSYTAKFAHKYVYGGHIYKFNTRRTIKGKVYYKIYGKKQYVRANYIEF